MTRSSRINFTAFSLLLLLVGGGAAYYFTSDKKMTSSGKVKKKTLIQRVTISGIVIPNRKAVISAPYNGYVKKLYVSIGAQVNQGDPIITLSPSTDGGSESAFPLRAPFAGTVVQVFKSEGEYAEQGSTSPNNYLVRLDDLSQLYVEASVPEMEVGKLQLGQDAIIKASALFNTSFQGKIEKISLAAKEQTGWEKSRVEFPISIKVTKGDERLRPGMSVILDVVTRKLDNVLTLGHEFIQKDGESYFVIVPGGGKKPVSIGIQNEEVAEIKSGLNEGDAVLQSDFLSPVK